MLRGLAGKMAEQIVKDLGVEVSKGKLERIHRYCEGFQQGETYMFKAPPVRVRRSKLRWCKVKELEKKKESVGLQF